MNLIVAIKTWVWPKVKQAPLISEDVGWTALVIITVPFALCGCSNGPKEHLSDFDFDSMSIDEVGPFKVGLKTITFDDELGRSLTADIWYPATIDDSDDLAIYEPTIFSRTAFREPQAADHEAPLVAFSHGLAAIRFQSVYLCERLASHGFAVVAVDHPLSTMLDVDRDRIFESVNNRPSELKAAVNAVFEHTQNNDEGLKIKEDNYVVSGHSLGTQTALALAGGSIDIDTFLLQCEQEPSLSGCGYRNQIDPNNFIEDHYDDRVIGLMLLSPGFWYTFGLNGDGLSNVIHSLSIVGDRDPILEAESEILPTVNALGRPKHAAIFHDAGHYGFSEMCDFAPFLSEECTETNTGWMDIDQIHDISNALIVAYVAWRHTGQTEYMEWLGPDRWSSDAITVQEYD